MLDQAGLHVASLHLHQPSLDDVFLAKTGRKLEGAAEDSDEAQAVDTPPGRGRRRGR
jgi:ABC-2 type transport system ATP-binding protein